MTTVLDRPTVDLAELPKPTRGDDTPRDSDADYLFYIDNRIVGRTTADCWTCAWKEGYRQWPTCRMAIVLNYDESELSEPCLQGPKRGMWFFYEGDLIVLCPAAVDCCNCAWQEGHPKVPLAKLAMEIPCGPADVHEVCRVVLKKLWRESHGG